ncbi:MAG TPA: hypothetical protein G4O02_06465 [Caldilineae bacterium]|nr:hypothetical protein [Caldilineae bacterium]
MSPSVPRRPLDWPITPLDALSIPARHLRAVARAGDTSRRQVDALRAELADLADLDAPWLRTDADPLGQLPVNERPGSTETPPPEPGRLGRSQALRPASGHPAGRRETRTGERPIASGTSSTGHTTDVTQSPQRSGAAVRSSASRSPTSVAPASVPNERPGSPDVPSGRAARVKRRPPSTQATAAIGPSMEQVPSSATPGTTSGELAQSSEEFPELAAWVKKRSRPALIAATRMLIGGPGLSRRRLIQHAMHAPQTAEQAQSRIETRGAVSGTIPQHQQAVDEMAIPSGEGKTAPSIQEGSAARQHPVSSMPSADFHLLAQLTERWFAARQTETPPNRLAGPSGPGLPPPGPSIAKPPQASTQPPSQVIASSLEEALQPSGPGDPATWQWISPIAGSAAPGANGAVPVASNTIYLTVQPPLSLETLDPDELADLLGQILRREARRYGIPMM